MLEEPIAERLGGGHWLLCIGDRVRVWPDPEQECAEVPHDPDERGHTGIVRDIRSTKLAPSHPFLVVFDAPLPHLTVGSSRFELPARHYAAHELARVE